MNFLDIFLIISIIIITGITIYIIIDCIKNRDIICIPQIFLFWCVFMAFLFIPFIVNSDYTGVVSGTIVSMKRGSTGPVNIVLKDDSGKERTYCTELQNVIDLVDDSYGKKADLIYNSRVGLYSTTKCHTSPVVSIKIYNEN